MASYSQSDFLSLVEAYLAVTGMPHAAFGRAAANDPWFVTHLRQDGELSDATANRVLDYVLSDLGDKLLPDNDPDHCEVRPLLEAVV
jgi:hypothetical protein